MTVAAAPRSTRDRAVADAADNIRTLLRGRSPDVAIVLGSGLGPFADRLADPLRIAFAEVAGFPVATVPGHGGELVVGTLAGRTVLAQSGRFHMYEGHSADTAALPVRAFAALGVGTLILTNAAGGIRRTFGRGTVMLIADQINFTFRNPLAGAVLDGEQRFPDMSDPYDPALRALARESARSHGVRMEEGVYAGVLGPSYETPAEIRMLDRVGADAVGMSTVIEVIAARARGIRCLGFSTVTNLAAGLSPHRLDHREVMEVAAPVQTQIGDVIEGVIGGS